MDARDNENPKLHICTCILSQHGGCACIWDLGAPQLTATNDIV